MCCRQLSVCGTCFKSGSHALNLLSEKINILIFTFWKKKNLTLFAIKWLALNSTAALRVSTCDSLLTLSEFSSVPYHALPYP